MKAVWNGQVLAESNNTVVVENNHYFPVSSLNMDYFAESDKKSTCFWKGEASYYSINVDGETNADAAWYYLSPKKSAIQIKDHVAFWRGVEIIE